MTARWQDVRCASIPIEALPALAELRRQPGIYVSIDRAKAWIWWEASSDQMRELLVRAILPTAGAELFTRRNGRWYRLGEHLPAFDVPAGDSAGRFALHRLVLPAPLAARRPAGEPLRPRALCVVRDQSGLERPASAVACGAHVLAAWADRATSMELALLQAVCAPESDGRTTRNRFLLLSTAGRLPLLPQSVRYWGRDLLVPLGYRVDPDLPESAIRRAAAADSSELLLFEDGAFERIPRALFRPVSRAAIRLACATSGADATATATANASAPEPTPREGEGGGL
jgi:MoxR-vWA-beta-propeller ternary system domain bpX2